MTDKPSILFVDDEIAILDGLKNRLRKDRGRWDISFVTSGAAALEHIRHNPIDIVVSDMRMPSMDGANLLLQVQQERPEICRIVLSGQSQHELTLKVLPTAHQFLSKPLDTDALRIILDRVISCQQKLNNIKFQRLIGQLKALPSPPGFLKEINLLLGNEPVNMDALASLIARDPAISARMLRITSSSYFGSAVIDLSIERSVRHLGVQTIKSLISISDLCCSLDQASMKRINDAQVDALQVAHLARLISLSPQTDKVYMAGLLHNFGQLMLTVCLDSVSLTQITDLCALGMSLYDAEIATIGISYAAIGAYLLGLWGLPETVVEAVALHRFPGKDSTGDGDVLLAVHAAHALLKEVQFNHIKTTKFLDEGFVEKMQASKYLPLWRKQAADIARNVTSC